MATHPAIRHIDLAASRHIAEIAAGWRQIETSCAVADRAAAELGVEIVYRASGWRPPRDIRWFDSPSAAAQELASLGRRPALFFAGVERFSIEPLRAQFAPPAWETLRRQCSREPRDRIKAVIDRSITRDATVSGVLLERAGCGQHDARWLTLYDVLDRVFGFADARIMRGIAILGRSCGWWWALQDVALLCERQSRLVRDERGRPHATDGPAIAFRDGSRAFAVHGVAVEPWIVESPEQITIEGIWAESNLEVRRVLIELFGPARYLAAIGAVEIARDRFGVLYRATEREASEPLVMVRVTNATAESDGTFREYFLRVPPGLTSARAAVAWTFGLDAGQYAPEYET